jgi:hypothetical protein
MKRASLCANPAEGRAHKRPRLRKRPPQVDEAFVTPKRGWSMAGEKAAKYAKTVKGRQSLQGESAAKWSIARPRWSGKTSTQWRDMANRMYSDPVRNHAFWDWAELEVLEEYMARFQQEVVYTGDDTYFRANWKNAHRALCYIAETLSSIYVVSPTLTTGLKRAIREQRAVPCLQTFLDLEGTPLATPESACPFTGNLVVLGADMDALSAPWPKSAHQPGPASIG